MGNPSSSPDGIPRASLVAMCRTATAGLLGSASNDLESADAQRVRRVMLWAPPRSLSTAVERALVEHPAIQVSHEPFGVPHYWSSEAASSREAGDARSSATFASVAKQLWDAAPAPGKQHIFSKNLAYYFAPHCLPAMSQMVNGDYSQVVHSFIVRHPAKAVASLYYKSCIDNEKTGYTHFDPAEAGFTAMWEILQHVEQQPSTPPCVIIDADDLLEDPEGIMTAYCRAVGLPFDPSMLSWEPGPVKELESPWTGWTDDVMASNGITRRAKRSKPPVVESLPPAVRDTIAEAMPIYEQMFARRLRPDGAGPGPSAEELKPVTAAASTSSSVGGTVFLLVAVLVWVLQAEVLQKVHTDEWNKPFFQAVMLKSVWSLTLPICVCTPLHAHKCSPHKSIRLCDAAQTSDVYACRCIGPQLRGRATLRSARVLSVAQAAPFRHPAQAPAKLASSSSTP